MLQGPGPEGGAAGEVDGGEDQDHGELRGDRGGPLNRSRSLKISNLFNLMFRAHNSINT